MKNWVFISILLSCTTLLSQSPILVTDFHPGPENTFNATNFQSITQGNKILVPIIDALAGEELGVIEDGNLSVLKDLWPGAFSSKPTSFTLFQDKILFTAFDEVNKGALWITDGTEGGTQVLFAPGNSEIHRPEGLISDRAGYLYFTYGTQLYRYDGQNFELISIEISFTTDFTTQGKNYSRYKNGIAFIRKKGTSIQLFVIENGQPLLRSQLSNIDVFGSAYAIAEISKGLVFTYSYLTDPLTGTYLWRDTDGSLSRLLSNNETIIFDRMVSINANRVLGLSFQNGIYSLDGTNESAIQLSESTPDLTQGESWKFFKQDEFIIFNTLNNASGGEKFYVTDGTEQGTQEIVNSAKSEASNIVGSGNHIYLATGIKKGTYINYFQANPSSSASAILHESNYSAAEDNAVLMLGIVDTRLYFSAMLDKDIGRELYFIPLGDLDQDGDGYEVGIDCNDLSADINPTATEVPDNAIDENCDGILEYTDEDNDGFNKSEDCDDTNPNINPDAEEIPNNDVDENCDGLIDIIDNDNDGYDNSEDCNDNDSTINPGAVEVQNNEIDENCDGIIEYEDADDDGYNSSIDCNDNDPNINAGAEEIPNNEIDENCDGIILIIDNDLDGFNSSLDCDDNNPMIFPNAVEIASNGIDEDCNGEDFDPLTLSLGESQIVLYPNPAREYLNVDVIGDPSDTELNIYSTTGILIATQALNQRNRMDIREWPMGINIIEILDEVTRKRVIVKHIHLPK